MAELSDNYQVQALAPGPTAASSTQGERGSKEPLFHGCVTSAKPAQ
jgi:hypothetical protein